MLCYVVKNITVLFKIQPESFMNYINTVVDLFSSYPMDELLLHSSHTYETTMPHKYKCYTNELIAYEKWLGLLHHVLSSCFSLLQFKRLLGVSLFPLCFYAFNIINAWTFLKLIENYRRCIIGCIDLDALANPQEDLSSSISSTSSKTTRSGRHVRFPKRLVSFHHY